jgi:hypothetical protein
MWWTNRLPSPYLVAAVMRCVTRQAFDTLTDTFTESGSIRCLKSPPLPDLAESSLIGSREAGSRQYFL